MVEFRLCGCANCERYQTRVNHFDARSSLCIGIGEQNALALEECFVIFCSHRVSKRQFMRIQPCPTQVLLVWIEFFSASNLASYKPEGRHHTRPVFSTKTIRYSLCQSARGQCISNNFPSDSCFAANIFENGAWSYDELKLLQSFTSRFCCKEDCNENYRKI